MQASGVFRPMVPGLPAARRAARPSATFSLAGAGGAASAPEGAGPVARAMLLQDDCDSGDDDRRGPANPALLAERAGLALDALGRLQRDLLGGGATPRTAMLEAAELPPAADPGLEVILRGIRTRARIELAREAAAHAVTSLKTTADQAFDAPLPARGPLGTGGAAR